MKPEHRSAFGGRKIKRGLRFLHAQWLNEKMQPLECEVTRVAQGCVYWKGVGDRRSRYWFKLEDAASHMRELVADS